MIPLGFHQNLHAVLCLAENSVSDRSTRPDDVHILYSGRSVEINNTDAEGRLVVSDGVVYAKKDLKVSILNYLKWSHWVSLKKTLICNWFVFLLHLISFFQADIIVDMCTLTGAQGISTGRYHAAHLTNSEVHFVAPINKLFIFSQIPSIFLKKFNIQFHFYKEWERRASVAGRRSGDLTFPLVYCPEFHFPEFNSSVADMKNSVAVS